MNIREMTEELRRAEEAIVFWKNSSEIRQKKLFEKDKEIERLQNQLITTDNLRMYYKAKYKELKEVKK